MVYENVAYDMIESYMYGLYLGVKTLPHTGDHSTNTYVEDELVSHSVCRRDAAQVDAVEQAHICKTSGNSRLVCSVPGLPVLAIFCNYLIE